jgi:hypothetical protein
VELRLADSWGRKPLFDLRVCRREEHSEMGLRPLPLGSVCFLRPCPQVLFK